MNFYLTSQTIATLQTLEEELHLSKTAIVEQALHYYAKIKLSNRYSLLQFAGKLKVKNANSLLKSIKSSSKNKTKDIEL